MTAPELGETSLPRNGVAQKIKHHDVISLRDIFFCQIAPRRVGQSYAAPPLDGE